MNQANHQLTIRLPRDLLAALRAEAIRSRSSISDLLKTGFADFLSRRVDHDLNALTIDTSEVTSPRQRELAGGLERPQS